MQTCFLCASPKGRLCPHCEDCYVCETHFELHFHKDQQLCFPYRVANDKVKGRILIASRDIKEEETVLIDKAAVYGPNLHPVCLVCLDTIKSSRGKKNELNYSVCSKCYFPSCGKKECRSDSSIHAKYECPIFAATGFKPKFHDLESPHFIYNVITVLRLILELQRNSESRNLIDRLMTHNEERALEFPEVQMGIQKMTHFFKNDLKIEGIEDKNVEDAFGVIKTNAMTFGNGSGRGLYPIGSLISHSCISNLEPSEDPLESLELRSKVPIKKGTELTIRYMSFWTHRIFLRDSLRIQWFFNCECERCQDSTDLGTNLSSELCSQCNLKSYIRPMDPLNLESDWICESCGKKRTKTEICKTLTEFPEPDKFNSINEIMHFIKKSEAKYHPNHFITLNYKYALAKWVTLKDLNEIIFVKLALKYYDIILGATDILDPGITKDKRRILMETTKLKIKILNHLKSQGKIDKDVYERQRQIIMALEYKGKNYVKENQTCR